VPKELKNDKMVDWFSKQAQAAGVPAEAAQKMFDGYAALQAEAQRINEENVETATKVLYGIWGADKVEANLVLASRTLNRMAKPQLVAKIDSTGLGNDPDLIELFYDLGKIMSEDTFLAGKTGNIQVRERAPGGLPMLDFPSMDKK
jgi:hypothetical protein